MSFHKTFLSLSLSTEQRFILHCCSLIQTGVQVVHKNVLDISILHSDGLLYIQVLNHENSILWGIWTLLRRHILITMKIKRKEKISLINGTIVFHNIIKFICSCQEWCREKVNYLFYEENFCFMNTKEKRSAWIHPRDIWIMLWRREWRWKWILYT